LVSITYQSINQLVNQSKYKVNITVLTGVRYVMVKKQWRITPYLNCSRPI